MGYLLLKFVHLTAAAFFIGGVFFEVMILSRAARTLEAAPREHLSRALGQRARKVMHWVVLALYGAGLGLAWHYRAALHAPFASSFGTLLTLKICLALGILGHFLAVVYLMRTGRMTPARSRLIHLSVLVQMLGILFLAKAMFLVSW
ncbi:CopD family copper resistance protein [Pseudomonas sp. GCM10022186]|uniref:CopD family copper resistance protein n=1 Tax=Pseudomonas sp. GCM10022186 TaxID=3252650 RepID=UPI003621CA2B